MNFLLIGQVNELEGTVYQKCLINLNEIIAAFPSPNESYTIIWLTDDTPVTIDMTIHELASLIKATIL